MRHQVKGFKLGRTQAHRKATLSALSTALIRHKRITTTITKAKALRMFVEPIINRAKEDSTANRRQIFRRLQDKEAVKELYGVIAGRIGERPGGYTRIVKLGQRPGDGAEMAIIELVDFNETGEQTGTGTRRARRTRRGRAGSGAATGTATKAAETEAPEQVTSPQPDAPEETTAEAPEETDAEATESKAPTAAADEPVAPMDPEAPEKTSEVSAQAPGTPLDAPEQTSGGPATNPETGISGENQQNQLR